MTKQVALKPRMSEKAYGLSEAFNTYVFDIPKDANKHSIKRAVEEQYEVTVKDVRVSRVHGKTQRSYKGRGRFMTGQRQDIKKAYVTLKEGDRLPLFAGVNDNEEPVAESKDSKDKSEDKK